MIASDIIYEGAAVGDNGNGYARPLQAGDPFRGFAEQRADNASGSAGDINVRTREIGKVELSISGLAITDVGKDVYASDDNTFILTQGSNTRIGYVHRWVASGVGVVASNTAKGAQSELIDSTAGTVDGTLSDVGATFDGTTLNNNFAELRRKDELLVAKDGLIISRRRGPGRSNLPVGDKMNDIIKMRDAYRAGYCVSGCKAFCERHGIDFKKITREGIEAKELLDTGDAMAAKIVEKHRQAQEP
ncbi:hypothetical protein [Thiohalophilus sp.]|uniref:hypothetical protein n=1 Tax=Thiohalophilus sp. TaxID=3028392 RepID=UPI002ACE79C9|nr:hypothetical protein [Thiohalophilus sp.]MDZ7804297.1 hypothetical protein [Thiohalophilus sp.]